MRTLEYHSDQGCRKGCHPVSAIETYRGKETRQRCFSVDEPGAWFDDRWNCHVDGCDHPCDSREEAIRIGARVLYQEMFHGSPAIVVLFRKRPFYETASSRA